ncbi:hypothetical protein A6V39_03395 [Candidatus Mycoplasma haematobovis]|uniref:Uncharacterized protein n=1 Tax=Candidatus Mycoplasma haematobovis TaxID=432608 RepID=A0A1A9QE28_9MOLU|nr:hypothetical protein [Candidatus Mycoplasma haematobovis]OAL09930.1 hypothetical protein A6V39_03395 [Candidatus Mycoplasma haematobovis]
MQLRLPLATKAVGFKFNSSVTAILSGLTAVGTCSSIIFNSESARSSISSSLSTLKNTAVTQVFLDGFNKVGNTFQNWGSAIINSKDDFVDWLERYLGINGIKSGTVALYEKLRVWVGIVYEWFATKFIKFIKNIPEMVKNWKELRLSLFKWGTFLGGGGGSAFWAMFGSGDNWGKLGELMGRPDFMDMMNDFSTLVQDNPEAFEELGAEGIEEIIEQYLEDPEKAKEAAKELIEEQKEKKEEANKDKEKDPEEKKEPNSEELTADEIKEKFNSKSGKPKDVTGVLGNVVAQGLVPILELPNSSFFGFEAEKAKKVAKEHMNKYIEELRKNIGSKKKGPEKEFLDLVEGNNQNELVEFLAGVATSAYGKVSSNVKYEVFAQQFSKELESKITQPCEDENNCDATDLAQKFKVGNKPKIKKEE